MPPFDPYISQVLEKARSESLVACQRFREEQFSSFINNTILHNIYVDNGIFAPTYKSIIFNEEQSQSSAKVSRGINGELMKRFHDLLSWLEEIDKHYPRTPFQVDIHNFLVAAVLHRIFKGDALLHHLHEIAKYITLEKTIQKNVIVSIHRRGGKSHSIAMFIVAWMLSQPNTRGCVYSNGRRCSNEMMAKIFGIMKKVCPTVNVRYKQEEMLTIIGPDGSDRTVLCFPDNPDVRFFHSFLCLFVSLSLSLQKFLAKTTIGVVLR
jgi:hypothetical protein